MVSGLAGSRSTPSAWTSRTVVWEGAQIAILPRFASDSPAGEWHPRSAGRRGQGDTCHPCVTPSTCRIRHCKYSTFSPSTGRRVTHRAFLSNFPAFQAMREDRAIHRRSERGRKTVSAPSAHDPSLDRRLHGPREKRFARKLPRPVPLRIVPPDSRLRKPAASGT